MLLISRYKQLKKFGLLGMNQRNADYILPHNPRRHYPLVDDKYLTKSLALKHQVATPKLYHLFSYEYELKQLQVLLQEHGSFVVKPAHGSGGDGILVIAKRHGKHFFKNNGDLITLEDIQHHLSNILSGMYSLSGLPDKAMIEYKVTSHPVFSTVSYQGVPDIRMIVYQGIPTMAMLRLPTKSSQGKANLHQGAVGVGINQTTGITTTACCNNQLITLHPDTYCTLSGIKIPFWEKITEISAQCYDFSQLGYLGVDIIIDEQQGPLMLELNARPGLSIQIANQMGLKETLKKIDNHLLNNKNLTLKQRLLLCEELNQSQ